MHKLLAAALVTVVGCVGAGTAFADDNKPSQEDLDKLLKSTDEIAQTVSSMRGLPIKTKIVRGIMSKAEITKRLIVRMNEDSSPDERAGDEAAMKRLGLMPQDMDLTKEFLALYTEQIAGFYDPDVKQLYIADWIDISSQRMVMAHEIDHALQDQSFDLTKYMKPAKDDSDEAAAHQAVAEGDGVALMIEFMFRENGLKQDPWGDDKMVNMMGNLSSISGGGEFDKAPLFMRESLVFPYAYGLKFIAASRKTHAWSDVDQMYKNPPASTEQIMHPEKYRAGEKPVVVKIPALTSFKGWKKIYENTFGELMWSVFFREHKVPTDQAMKAAAGWGGDHVVMFQAPNGGGVVSVDLSVWDMEMDAVEAFDALSASLLHLTGAAALAEKTDLYVSAVDAAGNVALAERKGTQLLFAVGVPKDQVVKVRAEIWGKKR